jgi:hypothetical protein
LGEAAAGQLEADRQARDKADGNGETLGEGETTDTSSRTGGTAGKDKAGGGTAVKPPPKLGRFHGSVALDPMRLGRDASRIAEEVVQHLTGLIGARVEILLEIQADLPDGAPDKVVRDVTENCRTLRFTSYGFEET